MTGLTRAAVERLETRQLMSGSFAHVYSVGAGGRFSSIAAAVNAAGPGDEVLILPGTYSESLNLYRSGSPGAPITIAAQTAGSVTLSGWGFRSVIAGNAQYITLNGINVNGCNNPQSSDPPAISTNTGWLVQNVNIQNVQGVGLTVYGSNETLQNVNASYCGRAGLSGYQCSNIYVQNCITSYNNTFNNDPDYDAGAGKWFQTDHVTLDGVQSYNNAGPGIWFDWNNTNVTIENCKSYNNHGVAHSWSGDGIRVEVSQGPFQIRNNSFWGNSGSNINIEECRNVSVTGNWMTGSMIVLQDWPRGSQFTLQNVSIMNNTLVNTQITSQGGTWNTSSGQQKNLWIDHNTYQQSIDFLWGSAINYTSLSDIRKYLGFEWNGVFAS